jgi:glycosyltransferase involved in cell wall biosynthesis
LTFLHYPQHITAEGHRYYTDQIEAATLQADHILVDSHSTRKDLIDILNVPADKITVHMLGVDESFKPLPSESLENVRQQLGLPRDYLLFVGTFEPRKNIAGLLQAYRGLLSQMPDAPSLVLVGRRGWLFDETMAHIQEMQLDKHIIWCDNIDDRALPALYNMAHVLITPSFYEGFGLPALEAMACGTVPIVSNRSSLPEVVGDVGLLIDPDDPATITEAIHHALTDSSWRATMSQAGIVRAKTFTWENTARIALETYRAVCQ